MDDRYGIYVENQRAIELEKQQREEEERKKTIFRKGRFLRYGIAGILYTIFYTFCLYKNTSGITYPFFVAGTLYFYCYCMKKSGATAKKESIFYMAATILLGISNVLTDNETILFLNRLGIFLLMINFLLLQYYNDLKWSFRHYFASMCRIIWGAITEFFSPYMDFFSFLKLREKKQDGKAKYVVLGMVIGLPFVVLTLCLLSSADMMFDYLFTKEIWFFLKKLSIWDNFFGIVWKLFLGLGIGYGMMAFMEKNSLPAAKQTGGQGEPVIGITITAMLAVVYVMFCGVQVVGLFGGIVVLPEGYSYAEYAREGFFQLLFVCLMNLVLVLFCLGYFRESRALKILLTTISLCTYVMTASSAFRMILYIRHYYLTFLRVFVLWALAVIAVFMAGILCRIYKEDFRLFRYGMVTVTVCYLLFSFSRPDYFIAKYNFSVAEAQSAQNGPGSEVDWSYLYRLSADAAPVLYQWETGGVDKSPFSSQKSWYEGDRERYWNRRQQEAEAMGIRGWNFSRYMGEQYQKRRAVWESAQR
ncbi:MAG: DUF4173 domain-containing protein [Clostridiales bacterium]|nr:DUF4173 domain-containing protein [Clostridiales bacterium]